MEHKKVSYCHPATKPEASDASQVLLVACVEYATGKKKRRHSARIKEHVYVRTAQTIVVYIFFKELCQTHYHCGGRHATTAGILPRIPGIKRDQLCSCFGTANNTASSWHVSYQIILAMYIV